MYNSLDNMTHPGSISGPGKPAIFFTNQKRTYGKGVRVSWWPIPLLRLLDVSFLMFSLFTIAVSLCNEGENLPPQKKNPS